jgi:hypothetical protein
MARSLKQELPLKYVTLEGIAGTIEPASEQTQPLEGDLLLAASHQIGVRLVGSELEQERLPYTFLIRSPYNKAIYTYLLSLKGLFVVDDDQGGLALYVPMSDLTLHQLRQLRIPQFIMRFPELFHERTLKLMSAEDLSEKKRQLMELLSEETGLKQEDWEHNGEIFVSQSFSKAEMSNAKIIGFLGAAVVDGVWGLFKPKRIKRKETEERGKIEELESLLREKMVAEERNQQQMAAFMNEMLMRMESVERKIDNVLEVVVSIQNDIDGIRATNRDAEEKLTLIHSLLDRRLSSLADELKDDLEDYVGFVQRSMEHWDKLDPLSREMLPLAEYLYDRLHQIHNVDFSPVILQYCRSLENEILKKIFIGFTVHLYRSYPALDRFLEVDFKLETTTRFARACKYQKGKPEGQIKYTFGEMNYILMKALEPQHVQSPLLKEFVAFVGNKADSSLLLSTDFTSRMKNIVDQYRNKCAHPNKLDVTAAAACRALVPREIDHLMGNILKPM